VVHNKVRVSRLPAWISRCNGPRQSPRSAVHMRLCIATILNVLTLAASKYNDVILIFLSNYVVITQNAEPVRLYHHGYVETQAK
jgi:hypothetical protein